MVKCKELQDCLMEAEQEVTALKSELEIVKSRPAAPDVVTQRAERSWAYLVAVATYHAQLPTVDWSLRISTALGGSVLASMKSDSKVDDLVSGHRKAEITWKWGRTAILLLYWQAIGAQQDATDVTEAFYRASMSWARLVKKMHHAQAEREHKVVQSWARLIFRNEVVNHRTEDIAKKWPRMADMLLALSRACVLHGVVRRWRRQAHQISAEGKETQFGQFGSSEPLTPERYANLVKPLEGLEGHSEQARDEATALETLPATAQGSSEPRQRRMPPDSAEPADLDRSSVDPGDRSSVTCQALLNWMRFAGNVAAETSKNLMHDIGLAVRRRQEKIQAKQIQQIQSLQDALRKQTSQTFSAHQMLFQESKRTLAHCKRFKTELVPVGLEEQCQQALVKCQNMLGLDDPGVEDLQGLP
eukprot:s1344_g5.t1